MENYWRIAPKFKVGDKVLEGPDFDQNDPWRDQVEIEGIWWLDPWEYDLYDIDEESRYREEEGNLRAAPKLKIGEKVLKGPTFDENETFEITQARWVYYWEYKVRDENGNETGYHAEVGLRPAPKFKIDDKVVGFLWQFSCIVTAFLLGYGKEHVAV